MTYDNVEMDQQYPSLQNSRSRVLTNSGMYVMDDFRTPVAPLALAQTSSGSTSNQYQSELTYSNMFGSPKLGPDAYKQTAPPVMSQSSYGMPQRGPGRGVMNGKLYSSDQGSIPSQQQPSRSIIQQGSTGVLRQQVFQFDNGPPGGDASHGINMYHSNTPAPPNSKNGLSMSALNIAGSTVLTSARPAMTAAKSPGKTLSIPSSALSAASNSSSRR